MPQVVTEIGHGILRWISTKGRLRKFKKVTVALIGLWGEIAKVCVWKIRSQPFQLGDEIRVHLPLTFRAQQFGGATLRAAANHCAFGTPGNDFTDPEFLILSLHIFERRLPANFIDDVVSSPDAEKICNLEHRSPEVLLH